MKAFKVYGTAGKNLTFEVKGYRVVHDDGCRRDDLQAMMAVIAWVCRMSEVTEWLKLDVGRLDVDRLG